MYNPTRLQALPPFNQMKPLASQNGWVLARPFSEAIVGIQKLWPHQRRKSRKRPRPELKNDRKLKKEMKRNWIRDC
jgi:hypothetical protein